MVGHRFRARPNEELYHLYIPKGKQTMGDFTMEVLPEIYEALQSQKTTGTAPEAHVPICRGQPGVRPRHP